MLSIIVPSAELWDERKLEFIQVKETALRLEHSLVSISKWESKWHKAFYGKQEKTSEEILHYIKCMTLTQNVDDNVYQCLTNDNMAQITEYIENPMTATYFSEQQTDGGIKDTFTSELFYYYMTVFNIPFECQKWHINRLVSLIKVCGIKNTPPKKMSKSQIMQRNRALNEARKQRLKTKG